MAPAASLSSGGVVREAFSESGFFAYVSWDINPDHNMKVGYGTASVDSEDRDRLSQNELLKNTTYYINYGYKVTKSFTAFAQLTHFDTEYGADFEEFSASVGRAGVVFLF